MNEHRPVRLQQQPVYFKETSMRITTFTLSTMLSLACSVAFAQPPAQQVQQDNADIHQINKDIRGDEGDLKKNTWDAHHDERDISRDQTDRNLDKAREEHDLSIGDTKGAAYWNTQRKDQNANIRKDKQDLAHSRKDISNDKARIAKDVKVRGHDVAKRNRAAKKA
jgi:hypothetical protein